MAAELALSEGIVSTEGAPAAVDALAAACLGATASGRVMTCSGVVVFSAAGLREAAQTAVMTGLGAERFAACFGGLPEEVRLRLACAEARKSLRPILLRTAADHLASESLLLASRLPGAVVTAQGDVTWSCSASDDDELGKFLSWMRIPGPGAIASTFVMTGCGRDRP